jgi:sugar/nucleoside kinase (ribokinase family)
MIPGVLCTGNIVIDLLTRPVDEIQWGGTRWVESITQSLGGNGANTSSALGKLGVPVQLIGAVGDDAFGRDAVDRLNVCGVDTRLLQRLPAATATTVALVRSDGARAFLHTPGVSRLMWAEGVPLTPAPGTTRFHLGNPFSMTHLRPRSPHLLAEARALGLRTSLDTAWDALGEWMAVLAPSLPLTDLLFLNEDEARMLTGTTDPPLVRDRLRNAGATTMVLKLGPRGCVVFEGGESWEAPAYDVPALDTTGAGDCFAGGFLAALQRGFSLRDAARVANAVGAFNVQSIGGTSGLRSWEETLAFLNRDPAAA